MTFDAPWFLLLGLAPLGVWLVARRSRAPLPKGQLRAVAVLQALALLGAVLALAQPSWRADGPLHHVVVVGCDDEATARDRLVALRAEAAWSDPFVVVRAGRTPVLGLPGHHELPAADGTPDLTAALRAAAAAVPPGARGEVILATDGRHDGAALAGATNDLAARGLPVRVLRFMAPTVSGPTILSLQHPVRTAPGEPFRLHAHVHADVARPARLVARCADRVLAERDVTLRAGEQAHGLDLALPGEGVVAFTVQLLDRDPAKAALAEAHAAALVDGPLRVLHLAADQSRAAALAAALRPFGIEQVAGDVQAAMTADAYAGYASVLVDDVPASG